MRKLEFAPLMEAAKTQVGENSVGFEWTGKPGQQFEVQLSENEQFARLVKAETVKGVSWQVASLLPGQYQMRIRQIFSNGVTGPYSPAVKFEILSYLRDGSGQSIKSGTGKPVELVK